MGRGFILWNVLPAESQDGKEREMMKNAKLWIGMVLMGIAGLVGSASGAGMDEIRFHGGHPWLSRNQMVDLEQPVEDGGELTETEGLDEANGYHHESGLQRSVSDDHIHAISKGRYFDLVIAMDKHRDEEERRKIGLIITNFARGVYEMTEGRHFIGQVSIVENPGYFSGDIHWHSDESSWSECLTFQGISEGRSLWINIYDTADKNHSLLNNAEAGGGTLTHEWGHYEYGFMDEYIGKTYSRFGMPYPNDIKVKDAIMAGWTWSIPFKEQCNLSYAFDQSVDEHHQGKWRSTLHTAQFRVFGKSCLEQLVAPSSPQRDWSSLGIFATSFKMPQWPEFADVNPQKAPEIDLDKPDGEANALKYLEIIWSDCQKRMFGICLDISGSMSEEQVENAKANAQNQIDRAPEGTLIGVWTFNDAVTTLIPLQEVTEANRITLKSLIDNIGKPGGLTRLWDAASFALSSMKAKDSDGTRIGSILLMTDGDDTASTASFSSVVKTCQDMKIAFNSVAFGADADKTGKLGEASAQTGGKNVSASDSLSALGEAFFRAGGYGNDRGAYVDTQGDVGSSGTWEEIFTVDSTSTNLQATVTLSVTSALANVALKTPSGVRCAPKSTTDVGNECSWIFTRQSPERGTWTVVVTAPVGTKVSCQVDASAVGDPPRLMVWTDESDTPVDAALIQGLPVDGARVRALVDDNGIRREIDFTGVGGGCYQLPLSSCGSFIDGFTVRADAQKGTATYTYVGVLGSEVGEEGVDITESFTRSEWLDLRRLNEIPLRYVEVHPRWPWEGKVDVDFHVVATSKNVKVSAKLVGIDNQTGDAYEVSSVTCDDTLTDLGTGGHRLTWDASADLPGQDFEDFSIRFDVTTGTALGAVTGLTASAGTYFDGVHVTWGAVSGATGYRVYRSESSDGTGKALLATQSSLSYVDSATAVGKTWYYWIQPIASANGKVKHEGPLTASGGGWRGTLGGISNLRASSGDHYDGVHLSWGETTGATAYRVYRGTTSSASAKTLIGSSASTSYIDTMAVPLQKYYYYWVEPIAVVSGTTYVGSMNSSPVSGWRNKLGTPTFHFENWRPGHKSRPDIDLYIDNTVLGATRYEYMSGAESKWVSKMDKVVAGTLDYNDYDGGKGTISSSASPKMTTIGWSWAYRYYLKVYVRAANDEGGGDWVKWYLADHLNESAFKNSEFYKLYPKP